MPEIRQGLQFQPVLRTLLEDGLTVQFRAGGRSMLPTIQDGDTLVVEPVNPDLIRRGDVVVADGPAGVRAHRVVGNGQPNGGAIVLRGDALRVCDHPVLPSQILGRVAEVKRNGRRHAIRGTLVYARFFLRRLLVALRDFLRMLGGGLRVPAMEAGPVSAANFSTNKCLETMSRRRRES